MIQRLLNSIQDYISLNQQELELLKDALESRAFEKGDVIFTEGSVSTEIYFVTHGCVRFFYNVDGH